jgi:TPR repeat protein
LNYCLRKASYLLAFSSLVLFQLVLSSAVLASEANGEPQKAELPKGRFTGPFNAGIEAYDRGDYSRAYALWLPIAQEGDLAAMRNVAHLLRHGLGVEKDLDKAARWYASAANRGLTGAQVNLAELFFSGEGLPQSYEMAGQWYARAARAGHAHAQFKLAEMIEAGQISPGNLDLAKKLYGWAIDAGHSGALDHYRQMEARQTPLNISASKAGKAVIAVTLQKSASPKTIGGPGDDPDTESFSLSKADRNDLLKAQHAFVSGERTDAVTLWKQLAAGNTPEAQFRLALACLQGQGVSKDLSKARRLLDIAATGGHKDAAALLEFIGR